MKISLPYIPTALPLVAILTLATLTACALSTTPTTTSTPPAVPGATATTTPTPTPSPTATLQVAVEVVARDLRVPWALAFAPDGRLFITERGGAIRVLVDGQLQPYATLDVAQEGESGLLGLALDPNFEDNGYLYVYHTYPKSGFKLMNRVVRLEDRGDRAENPIVLLDQLPAARIHNGGRLKFGPDGKLYITVGDAASPPLAQDLDSLAGKILRINKDGSIPADNPFPDSPVYSYGHRNPQGLAWHPVTGRLFSTEHGPVGHDEVNLIEAGANYGWPDVIRDTTNPNFQDPLLQSDLATWAPSGAAFYDSNVLPPEWQGRLVFAALRGQRLVWLTLLPPEYRSIQERDSLFGRRFGRLRDVVQGPDGFLYFVTNNLDGRGSPRENDDLLLRIVPVTGSLSYLPLP